MSTQTTPAGNPFDLTRLCRYFSERSPQPMLAVEGSTHVVRYVNPAFARLIGKTSEALVGRPFAEAVPEGVENGCLTALDRVFRTGTPENLAEREHRRTPIAYWTYALWAILGADELPVGVMIQVTDVTETGVFRHRATAMNEALVVSSVRQHELIDTIRRGEQERHELEVQLFQAQKLESLGVLAGGIAHDLNNMLTPVLGFAELASHHLPEGSPAAPLLEEVSTSARRAADLVQQILAYAGKGRFVIQPVDLSAAVREMSELLRSAVSIHTEIEYDLAPALPAAEADVTQLRQVIMNLVANASEAMAEKVGVIAVRTGLTRADHEGLRTSGPKTELPKGPCVFLEVTDAGCGMTAEIIEKIFDPFFTTKFTGRGLGLAVVQGIVRGHRGILQVRSSPGQGSTFRLLLPCSTRTAAIRVVPHTAEGWRGTGTVLVIDDEKGVRDVVARILEKANLTALVADNAQDGLRTFGERQREIDAVLLDMTMPGMGGLEAARQLQSLRPNIPVVLMSGYSISEATIESAGCGITGFVKKPFDLPDLLAAVRRALGQ